MIYALVIDCFLPEVDVSHGTSVRSVIKPLSMDRLWSICVSDSLEVLD